jgi:hypothetical protein
MMQLLCSISTLLLLFGIVLFYRYRLLASIERENLRCAANARLGLHRPPCVVLKEAWRVGGGRHAPALQHPPLSR